MPCSRHSSGTGTPFSAYFKTVSTQTVSIEAAHDLVQAPVNEEVLAERLQDHNFVEKIVEQPNSLAESPLEDNDKTHTGYDIASGQTILELYSGVSEETS